MVKSYGRIRDSSTTRLGQTLRGNHFRVGCASAVPPPCGYSSADRAPGLVLGDEALEEPTDLTYLYD